ncbi:MAG: peptidylprolyl isomerase [Candidatus Obscuribacterales bacterium]
MRVALLVSVASLVAIPLFAGGCTQPEAKKESTAVTPGPEAQKPGDVRVAGSKLIHFHGITEKINRERIPETAIICMVGDDAINVSDYKNAFRYKQGQAKQMLQPNPQLQRNLVKRAESLGIKLTDEESKSLLEKSKAQGGTQLQDLFKSGKVKEKDFEKQVLQMGLALKVTNHEIEENLLNEMINNSLLLQAARHAGLGKTAFNRYVEFKHSPSYKEALKLTTLTPNQLKDAVIEDFLISLMKEKIIKKAEISDKSVYDVYLSMRDKRFRHPGRFRWSQIFIAAPLADFGIYPSMATAIKREYPKKTPQEQAEMVKSLDQAQAKKANDLLARALKGEDFARLANEKTDDAPARASKTGGDMGFATVSKLNSTTIFRPISTAIQTMNKGDIYPKPVRTPAGYHIIKLTDKTAPGYLPFDEVKDELKPRMAQKVAGLAVMEWLLKQRETVPITFTRQFSDIVPKDGILQQRVPDSK